MVVYSRVLEHPTLEPVTLAEAKTQLHIDQDLHDEDDLINSLIKTARRICENYSGLSFVTQVRSITLDNFPCYATVLRDNYFNRRKRHDGIIVPYGPVQSIDSIKYFDGDNVEQTLDPAEYYTDLHSDLARIFPASVWPATKVRPNAVTIEYTAGYDSVSGIAFPGEAKTAMLLLLSTLYENRQDEVIGSSVNLIGWNSRVILDNIKVYWSAAQD